MALTIKNTNLIINTEPEYADQIVTLESSDENIVVPVSSTESGTTVWTLEPRGTGTATITATTPGGYTSSVDVTVVEGQDDDDEGGGESEPTPTTVPVENIYFHEPNSLSSEIETLGLALDKSGVIEMNPYVTVLPNNATDKSWRLVSSNTNILGVSGTSVFTKSAGSCSLTAITSNNCADTISVTVTAIPAESVSFTTSRLDLPIGATKDLTDYVTFTPALSIYDEYSFRSSRSAVAKVTGNSIKGVSAGLATVTVTTGSGKTDTLIVNVPSNSGGDSSSDSPLSFYIDCSKTILEPGEEATVWIRSVDPETFDLTSRGELQLAFTNSRGYVVGSHDESGTFTIKAYDNPGNDTLWMMWRAGSKMGWISSNSINFTVQASGSGSGDVQPVLSSVSISLNTSGIIPGDLIQANVVINPSNYSPNSIIWSSSNTTVATVTNTGYISCIGEGTTVISVSVDGRTATKTLVVGNDNGSEINPPDWSEDDTESPLMGTNVSDPILPWTTADEYATHYAKYGKGGYRSVSNISERNAIPALRREEGMLVWVISENKLYQLRNGYWITANLGGGGNSGSDDETPGGGSGCNCEELESRISALEAILLAQQQEEYERQLDNSPYTVTVSGLQPSGSKYEVGTEVGTLSFNYGLSGPVPVPSMQSAIINGATYSPASGSYSGGAVDSSSSGTKTLYNIEIKYFDTRYGQLDKYKDAGGKLKSATASKNIMFGYKIYCGKTTLGPADFSWPNLSGSVIGTPAIYTGLPTKSSPLTFSYTVTNGRAWVAYPKAWGQNVDIRDSKGDSYAINFSFKEISVPVAGNSVQYYLYYLTGTSSVTDFEFNFSKK